MQKVLKIAPSIFRVNVIFKNVKALESSAISYLNTVCARQFEPALRTFYSEVFSWNLHERRKNFMKFYVFKDAEFNGNNYFASFLHVFILDLLPI